MSSSIHRVTVVALLLAASACDGNRGPLPEVPRIDDDGYRPAVREQLATAYAAFDAAPDSAAAAAELGKMLHAYQQYAAAEVAYHRARRLAPAIAAHAYLHGVVLHELGEDEAAVAAFRRAVRLDPDIAQARARLVRAHLDAGDLRAAGKLVAGLRGSTAPELVFLAARILMQQDRMEDAGRILGQLLVQDIRLPPVIHAAAAVARARGDLAAAGALLAEHDSAAAGPEFTWPDPLLAEVSALNQTAAAQLQRAEAMIARGAPLPEVADLLERALHFDPDAYEVSITLVGVYGRMKDFRRADQHYERALAVAPDVAQLHFNRGLAKMKQQHLAQARSALERAAALDPQNTMTRAVLGQVMCQQGDHEEGLARIAAAIATSPHDPVLREVHAQSLLDLQRYDEALQTLAPVPANPQRQAARQQLRARAYRGLGVRPR